MTPALSLSADPARWAWAALAFALWLGLCVPPLRQRLLERRARRDRSAGPLLVAFASQGGQAAQWAQDTVRLLHARGRPAQALPLQRLRDADLAAARQLLFIASTTGEGDPPDHAAVFAGRTLRAPRDLRHLCYGLLALGDRQYAGFCGFGRRLDHWLAASGARPAFARIEADGEDAAALGAWLREVARFAGTAHATPVGDDVATPAPARLSPVRPWRLLRRQVINPGSPGAPIHYLVLQPPDGAEPWQAGDVARIHIPAQGGRPACWREYSLASLPHGGQAELLVRAARRTDGRPGAGSGWLGQEVAIGDAVPLQIRRNPGFHAPAPGVPLILIGNGTGLAGLLAHLEARAQARQAGDEAAPAWLLYGERSARTDAHADARLQAWRASGLLQRLDRAFSRDPGASARYVQDLIAPQADALRSWVQAGAALYVCGQRLGMGQGVHAALARVLGERTLDELDAAGRYRRDLY